MKISRAIHFLYLCAIAVVFSPASAIESLNFKIISAKNGLEHPYSITSFEQSNGYMWFSSSHGVSRFDGKYFKHFYYNVGGENHISNNYVLDIVEDHLGAIWLASENGLNRINPDGTIDIFTIEHGLPSNWTFKFYIDDRKRLWVATHKGVVIYEPESDRFEKVNGIDSVTESFDKGSDNQLWIPTRDKLYRYDLKNDTHLAINYELLGINNNSNITYVYDSIEYDNSLFLSVDSLGLVEVDTVTLEYQHWNIPELTDGSYISSFVIKDNMLWVGTSNNGVLVYNLKDKQLVAHYNASELNPYSLPSNQVNNLFIDSRDNLWVNTSNYIAFTSLADNGLKLFQPNVDINISASNMISAFTIAENKLFAAVPGGLQVFDLSSKSWKPKVIEPSHTTVTINDIVYREGVIWGAANNGLVKYDLAKDELSTFENKPKNKWNLPENNLRTALVDEITDSLWFTGYDRVGLSRFNEKEGVDLVLMEKDTDIYTSENNHALSNITASNGDIWLGTTDGFFRVTPTKGSYRHYKVGNQAGYIRISAIKEDNQGNLWATSQGEGLIKVTMVDDNEVSLTHYKKEHGFPSNDLFALALDGNNIWVTTMNQIILFDLEKLKVTKVLPKVGIDELNFQNAKAAIYNNELIVASNFGLVFVDVNKSGGHALPVNVITEFYSGEDNYSRYISSPNDALLVDGSYLKISFSNLDYNSGTQAQFKFRLTATQPYKETNSNFVEYYNLWPGSYTFEVLSKGASGLWSQSPATLTFTVKVPLYFYIIGILAIILVAMAALFLINNRLKLEKLQLRTETDFLTGLLNRFGFNKAIGKLKENSQSDFTLLMLDLDKFKQINDTYGHLFGDEYLKCIANKMKASVKAGDIVARISGDEFAVILNNYQNEDELRQSIQRIHNALQKTYMIDGIKIEGSISIGVAKAHSDITDFKNLLTDADNALYEAKNSGRGQVSYGI